jgi:hypothetical protein
MTVKQLLQIAFWRAGIIVQGKRFHSITGAPSISRNICQKVQNCTQGVTKSGLSLN